MCGKHLTITAANHVIHYGRWWNPAKENQATDRAYRIGQTKKVHVYHFIGKDPKNEFETFDEILDNLLRSREALADNFLAPDTFEMSAPSTLANDIFGVDEQRENGRFCSKDVDVVTMDKLDAYEFEAMVAMLMKEKYRDVLLTPRSRDGGVDVVCLGSGKLTLVQCKHTNSTQPGNQERAIHELIDGLDYYRESFYPPVAKTFSTQLILATNGFLDKATLDVAKRNSVEIIDRYGLKQLSIKSPITRYRLSVFENDRHKNIQSLFDSLSF